MPRRATGPRGQSYAYESAHGHSKPDPAKCKEHLRIALMLLSVVASGDPAPARSIVIVDPVPYTA